MIDIENQVFDTLSTALKSKFPKITVKSGLENIPSAFPSVHVEEADNFVRQDSIDSGSVENHAHVMFEINVYSNHSTIKKSESKRIFSYIDGQMAEMGFVRMMKIGFFEDNASRYRMIGRYAAVVAADETIYSRR
jgi:hypothetical protein